VSALLHVVALIVGLFILPGLGSGRKPMEPIYTVNLISLPPAGGAAVQAPPAPPKAEPKPTPPATPPAPQPEPVKAPEPVVEKPMPIAPPEPAKPAEPDVVKLKKAPPEVKPVPKKDPTQAINEALARLESKVKQGEKADQKIDQAISALARPGSGQGEGAGVGLSGTGPITEMDARLRDYYLILFNIVSANWILPESLIGDTSNLEAVYIIRIEPTGKISRAWFERSSGQKVFDQSVEKALAKTSLPPLPDILKGQTIEVGLRFTPSGLRRR